MCDPTIEMRRRMTHPHKQPRETDRLEHKPEPARDDNETARVFVGDEILSWEKLVLNAQNRRLHRHNIVDDGFFSPMAKGARFESILQFPHVYPVDPDVIPNRAIPFSKLGAARPGDCCVFHENDPMFADYLVYDEVREEAQAKASLFAPADCSVYTDMPFCLQPAAIYMSRLSAHDLQRHGRLHAPLCRWGDERTYLPYITETPIAFIGLPRHNAVWVGTYGVSKKRRDRDNLRRGLVEMLKWLEPIRVFIYGPTPKDVFDGLWDATDFVVYPNWTKLMREGKSNGQRRKWPLLWNRGRAVARLVSRQPLLHRKEPWRCSHEL